jgi:tripartite-type tricarboxylate transporter receptor subunit TctC
MRELEVVGRGVLALALMGASAVFAQAYPAKPVRIIVAQAPGGASDQLIRLVAQKLSDPLGQQFIIDNRPGAGGNIGAEAAAKSAPDGYTLFMVSAPHIIAPSVYRKLSYDLARDFAPITLIGSEPLCAVVHPSLPVKGVRDFVAFLKPRPGQVSYGSTGNGAVNHLATELFKSRAGVDMVHVPYKGSAFAIPDVMSGLVQVLFANVSPLQPHIQSGRLKPLAVTSTERVRALPAVPTIAESGYAGYEAVNWFGLVAPARTPDEIVRKLNGAIRQSIALPDVREFYENRGTLSMSGTPEEMRAFMQRESEKWARVVKDSGARID